MTYPRKGLHHSWEKFAQVDKSTQKSVSNIKITIIIDYTCKQFVLEKKSCLLFLTENRQVFGLNAVGSYLLLSFSNLLLHGCSRWKKTTGLVGAVYTFCFVITWFIVKVSIYETITPANLNSFVKSPNPPVWLSERKERTLNEVFHFSSLESNNKQKSSKLSIYTWNISYIYIYHFTMNKNKTKNNTKWGYGNKLAKDNQLACQ